MVVNLPGVPGSKGGTGAPGRNGLPGARGAKGDRGEDGRPGEKVHFILISSKICCMGISTLKFQQNSNFFNFEFMC